MGRQPIELLGRIAAAGLLGCAFGCTSLTPPTESGDVKAAPPLAERLAPASASRTAAAGSPSARVNLAADAGVTHKKAPMRWSLGEQDKTLKTALQRWTQDAGWRLVWELGVDYRIEASASLEGPFETAITEVMKNMEHADVPPRAIFYRGNQVLRVVPRGME